MDGSVRYYPKVISEVQLCCLLIILLGTVDGSCRRGRPRKSWGDGIKQWTGQSLSSLSHIADDIKSIERPSQRGRMSVYLVNPQRRLLGHHVRERVSELIYVRSIFDCFQVIHRIVCSPLVNNFTFNLYTTPVWHRYRQNSAVRTS